MKRIVLLSLSLALPAAAETHTECLVNRLHYVSAHKNDPDYKAPASCDIPAEPIKPAQAPAAAADAHPVATQTHTVCLVNRLHHISAHKNDPDYKSPPGCDASVEATKVAVAPAAAVDADPESTHSHMECVVARTKYMRAHAHDSDMKDPGPCPVDTAEAQQPMVSLEQRKADANTEGTVSDPDAGEAVGNFFLGVLRVGAALLGGAGHGLLAGSQHQAAPVPAYQPPVIYNSMQVGQQTYVHGSDGSSVTATQVGNQTYVHASDGSSATATKVGTQTYIQGNDGTRGTSTTVGGTTYTNLNGPKGTVRCTSTTLGGVTTTNCQ
ncbi:MAG: hypothetical protein ACLQDQ_05480 [Myxococcaceae bacterium]